MKDNFGQQPAYRPMPSPSSSRPVGQKGDSAAQFTSRTRGSGEGAVASGRVLSSLMERKVQQIRLLSLVPACAETGSSGRSGNHRLFSRY